MKLHISLWFFVNNFRQKLDCEQVTSKKKKKEKPGFSHTAKTGKWKI